MGWASRVREVGYEGERVIMGREKAERKGSVNYTLECFVVVCFCWEIITGVCVCVCV